MEDQGSQSGDSNANSNTTERSDFSASTSPSDHNQPIIHPLARRPGLPSRKSSGPLVVSRESSAVGPVDLHFGPDDVRAMSPRRTSKDIDQIGQKARQDMRRRAHRASTLSSNANRSGQIR